MKRRAVVTLIVVVIGLAMPARAEEEGPVPGSCSLHPVHMVNPGCVPALAGQVGDAVEDVAGAVLTPPHTYPNLVPNVVDIFMHRPLTFDPETFTVFQGPPRVFFDTRAQNLGIVPVQLTLTDAPDLEDTGSAPVSQCVVWVERACRALAPVGGFVWHEPHRHWHFEEFAAYELRRLTADGGPDYSHSGLLAVSDKVSFCFIDSTRVRDDALPVGPYRLCTPTVQGISPGWADIYGSGLPGQTFSFEHLTDGRYALVVYMNYAERLYETDFGDNVVEVIIEVSGDRSAVRILDRFYP